MRTQRNAHTQTHTPQPQPQPKPQRRTLPPPNPPPLQPRRNSKVLRSRLVGSRVVDDRQIARPLGAQLRHGFRVRVDGWSASTVTVVVCAA